MLNSNVLSLSFLRLVIKNYNVQHFRSVCLYVYVRPMMQKRGKLFCDKVTWILHYEFKITLGEGGKESGWGCSDEGSIIDKKRMKSFLPES